MIIPHDPLEYTSNLVPMIHAHFVISTLEAAADESRALRKVAPCEDARRRIGGSGDGLSQQRTLPCIPCHVRRAHRSVSRSLGPGFHCGFVRNSAHILGFVRPGEPLLPFAARRAGRPSFSVWEPALLCSGLYLLLCLGSRFQSPVLMSFVLVFHGALILFASPKPSEGAKGSETRAAIATKSHRLPPVGRRNVLLRDGWPSSFDDCRVHAR